MLKKLLSYIVPINIYQKKSSVSRNLEVTWNNGQLVLDSANTNYSFGSLQRILKKGLRKIGFEKIVLMQDVLVLGVAGGSVINTLVDDVQYNGKITGIEIDADIIKIANDYFQLDAIPNLEIIIGDANAYVLQSKNKFDLIIIDVFQDNSMPGFLFEQRFIEKITLLLSGGGFLLFNTMVKNQTEDHRNKKYLTSFDKNQFKAQKILKIERNNELIIVEKLILPL